MSTIERVLMGVGLLSAGCSPPGANVPTTAAALDYEVELALIEQTRSAFQAALNAGRYDELGQYVTPDVVTIGPGSAEWDLMRELGADRETPFPYDSIHMRPAETEVVSDSVAKDFGQSTIYYTSPDGTVERLTDTFLAILKKGTDGVWRLHREVASARTN